MSASLVDFLHAFVPSPQPNSREITSEWEGMILLLTIKGHFQAEHNILSPDKYIKYYDMIKIWRIKKCGNSLSGWLEWGKNIVNVKSLNKSSYLPASVVEFLVWFHFGSSGKSWIIQFCCLQKLLCQSLFLHPWSQLKKTQF